jgi:hypothetical protein
VNPKLVKALLFVLLLPLAAAPLFALNFPIRCAGTYMIEEDGGAIDFWTFEADGNFFGTTSTQPLFNFSNQQGRWRKDGADGAKGVLFAFVYDDDNTLLTTARIDISFSVVGKGCGRITGSLEVRTFEDGEDPLDPATDTGEPIATDTFTGRRVKVKR